MNILRLIAIALPVILLMGCGGGGGGSAARTQTMTPPNPLNVFNPTANSLTIEAVSDITGAAGVNHAFSSLIEVGNFGSEEGIIPETNGYDVTLPGDTTPVKFVVSNNLSDLSLATNGNNFFGTSGYTSTITNGVTVGDVTLARGRLTGTRASDSTPLEFQTFSGWLSGSIFGITQITFGASGNEQYRFISNSIGVRNFSNPTATGSETTSAIWKGVAVASIKADRTFIRGDATVTVNFTDTNVDVMLDNWRGIDGRAMSNVLAISYEGLTLVRGGIIGGDGEQLRGRFYGTDHAEVGAWFNTMDVAGAFGGRRQTGQ